MKPLSDYFSRLGKLEIPNKEVREAVQNVIEKDLGIKIDISKISLRGDTVYLKINPIEKSEVAINKELILKKIKEKLDKKTPADIR